MITNLFKSSLGKLKAAEIHDLKTKGLGLSVGLKMMLSVGLISICCIGVLVYLNVKVFSQVGAETQTLLEINSSMNKDLRASIFDLQKKYLNIPKRLHVDAGSEIQEWIKTNYAVDKETIIEGRENYRQFFNRSQRREISKGHFVIQQREGKIILSKGMVNKENDFLEKINQIHLKTENGTADAQTIAAYIHNAVQMADGDTALKKRVIELSNYLADEAIAAEKSRNAILYKVEEIESKKANLISYRKNKQHTIILMAVLTILINLVLLHLMVWLLVERPLTRLTRSLYQINKGEILHIPYQNRRDRVGVLAGALKKFEDVLIQLRNDDLKKKVQRQTIQELIQQMSCMIETIQTKAQTMKKNAVELSILAGNTEEQTTNASESASRTVKQTNAVSHSTQKLQSAVQDIIGQLSKQNNLVGDINSVTQASREDMAQLNQASREISEIVSIVKNIAGQTKLLALNARIEAGRAGAAGKGFAVVARETRALCMQTEAANEKIENKITAIQKASKTIVQYTQQTDMRIERLMLAGHNISAAAEEQDTVTCGISKSADAAASDIKNVTKEIAKVNKAASATSRFAVSVQSYSEQIESQLSDLLKETREKLLTAGLTENLSSSIDMGAANDQLPIYLAPNQSQAKKTTCAA